MDAKRTKPCPKPFTAKEIPREFNDGFTAAVLSRPRLLSASDHWLAGYDVGISGCKLRDSKLSEYIAELK